MDETTEVQLTYEEAFSSLEQVVAALETDRRPLEETLELFQRGQVLARYCARLLDEAELKIQRLAGEKLEPYDLQE